MNLRSRYDSLPVRPGRLRRIGLAPDHKIGNGTAPHVADVGGRAAAVGTEIGVGQLPPVGQYLPASLGNGLVSPGAVNGDASVNLAVVGRADVEARFPMPPQLLQRESPRDDGLGLEHFQGPFGVHLEAEHAAQILLHVQAVHHRQPPRLGRQAELALVGPAVADDRLL